MTVLPRAPLCALTFSVSLVLVLAGCASGSQPAGSGAANSPETSKAYSDCLVAEGIDGVFTDDDGYVGVSIEVGPIDGAGDSAGSAGPGDPGGSGDSSIDIDAGPGAAYADAETTCRAEVPAYHPRVDTDDPALTARLLEQSRAFASCARLNGLADFPDPDAAAGGKLVVPDGTTKSQFLAVVTACASTFAADVSPTDGAEGSGAVTLSMPQFGGAYDSSWSGEVTDIIFAAMEPAATPLP